MPRYGSSSTALAGTWSSDWVLGIPGAGGWNLRSVDQLAANFEGGAGKPTPSATIATKVPGSSLSDPLESLAVQIYRLRPAADGSAPPKIDAETLERLRQEGRLEPVAGLSGEELAAQIRKVGRRSAD